MAGIYRGFHRQGPDPRTVGGSGGTRGTRAARPEPPLPPYGSIMGNLALPSELSHQATSGDCLPPYSYTKASNPDIASYSASVAQPHATAYDCYSALKQASGSSDEMGISQIDENELNMCAMCEQHSDVWFCNACDTSFCGQCWGTQFLHRKPRGGIPHEKTNPDVATIVHNALSPPIDARIRERLYKADASTAWFGVERHDDFSPVMFRDYGRFTELMTTTDPMRKNPGFLEQLADIGRDKRTPSLVSFVGQTGSGKSTLIKLLIDFAVSSKEAYPTPVIGPRGEHLPTSDNVHLYMEPRTASSQGPLLYADCEGLEGGEREPQSAFFRKKRRAEASKTSDPECEIRSERELKWANEPRAKSREFAVVNLYPRLLYTFSDVIVFVLRNPRVIEHVFERLMQWAAAAIETSSNQPALPHAIIALNATEHGLSGHPWDVVQNTETILNDLAQTVDKNDTFKKWAQFWRERGRTINSLYDLITCYYSSIQIIRLPAEGRPNLMEEQVRKLYDSTLRACTAARCARYQARMLLDVEELHGYLQDAFNHYSTTLESPFDFVEASFRNSAIPEDFGGNILKLALAMMKILRPEEKVGGGQIIYELRWMVASCIMLDSARNKNKGSASQIFPKYINHLDDALENLCNNHWPCEFVKHRSGARCVNVKSGHSKGHQSVDGKVFAAGDWVSNFTFEEYSTLFRDWVYYSLEGLLRELAVRSQSSSHTEEQVASRIHKDMVLTVVFTHSQYSHSQYPGAKLRSHGYMVSHRACFCCLFGQAEHVLPCGHVLCSACVRTYGNPRDSNRFEINECPFESGGYNPWMIHLIPKSAGVRVITLDGGGIRGIVELEVLRQIQLALGDVPIQCFVDLIVGTSTGGLVALGLGSMNWTVQECIGKFKALCGEAFTPRKGGWLPVVGSMVEHYHHSKYETSPLERALKLAFTDEIYLFGGLRPSQPIGSPVKVAVTAASLDGTEAYVISNYNRRQQGHKPDYYFQRPESDSAELRIWEAARATAAAPTYFKSFHHEESQKIYIDGAILHNNPIRIADSERRMIWPSHQVPDLVLSIGTGCFPVPERRESRYRKAARNGILSHGLHLYGIMRNNFEQKLNCEKAWDEYYAGVVGSLPESISTSRFHRVNPDVGEIPALDEKEKMEPLRAKAEQVLMSDLSSQINQIARQLIASSFYFELLSASNPKLDGTTKIYGKIYCRLIEGSREIYEFGRHILTRAKRNENLQFMVSQDGDTNPLAVLPLTSKTTDSMMQKGIFYIDSLRFTIKNRLSPTQIHLCFGSVQMHPISGFPRLIIADDERSSPNTAILNYTPGTSSQRYTHGSRRLKRYNSKWKAPDLRGASSLSNLHEYATKRDCKLGHDFIEPRVAQSARKQSQPSVQTRVELPAGISKKPTVKLGIRETFPTLMWPLRTLKEEAEDPDPTDTGSMPPDLEEWFREYRNIQGKLSVPAPASGIPPEEIVAALRNYNVKPEEYAVYEQWVNLLQPDKWKSKGYWLPPIDGGPENVARSETPGKVHELDSTTVAELMDTSPSKERDS